MKRFDINYIYIISTILVIAIFVSLFVIVATTPSITENAPTVGTGIVSGGGSMEATSGPDTQPTFIKTPIVIYDMTKGTVPPSAEQPNQVVQMENAPQMMYTQSPSQIQTTRGQAGSRRIMKAQGTQQQQPSAMNTTGPNREYEVNYQQGASITPGMMRQTGQTGGPRGNTGPTLVNPAVVKQSYVKKSDVQTQRA
jgi:hypothetical protein